MSNSSTAGSALDGMVVLELCSFVAGPFCAKLLGDMGADVVKIERPGSGDESRARGPFYRGQPGPDASLLYIYLNSNKRGITLDVTSIQGKEIFLELAKRVDLLVEDLPTRLACRLGLDYPSLQGINSKLVVTSLTPFGSSGPYRDHKAHYLNTYHAGGDAYLSPPGRLADQLYPDREPLKAGGYLGEYQAGLSAAVASMAATMGRLLDGQGCHIDVSKQEALVNLNGADFCQYPDRGISGGREGRHLSGYIGGLYRCKDGFWEILVTNQRLWDAMVGVMGRPSWSEDERFATFESSVAHREELDGRIEEWAMGLTREEIYHSLAQAGCAAGPVLSTEEVLRDRQMEHRGFFAEMDHPRIGKYRAPSAAYMFSHTPWAFRRPAPSLGQHNEEIYGGWLGCDREEQERLRREGVI